MRWLVISLLSFLSLWSYITIQALRLLPLKELRQRTRAGADRASKAIYGLAEFGAAGLFSVWLVGSLAFADLLFLAYRHLGWLAGAIVLLAYGLILVWRPVRNTGNWAWSLAGGLAALISYLLSFIKKPTDSFNRLAAGFYHPAPAANFYQKDDLTELLKRQSELPDNRIDRQDLSRALKALSMSDKTVGQIMVPLSQVKWVEADETVGPSIMDELHQTGQKRFALVKNAKAKQAEILGSLYIGDLLKHLGRQSKLRDIMHPGVYYLNEALNLEEAMGAILKTGSLMLVVVNGRQEVVGLLPADKLIEESVGQLEIDDFNDYDDIRLAADHEPYEISDKL